jgi:hypothetical protein
MNLKPAARTWLLGGGAVLALLALAAVFAAYLKPGLMVDLANRLWSCF